jgi:hypothetical protein
LGPFDELDLVEELGPIEEVGPAEQLEIVEEKIQAKNFTLEIIGGLFYSNTCEGLKGYIQIEKIGS